MRENTVKRFIKAQETDYKTALAEIRRGHKRSCWMWYIFPQIEGLGSSGTAMYYAIKDFDEAKEYMENPVTGGRLREISEALLELESDDATQIMGWPDDLKLRSSMTLFALATKDNAVFLKVLDKYFDSKPDAQTVDILNMGYLVMRIDEPDFGCEGCPDGVEPMAKVTLMKLKNEEEIQLEIADAELYRKNVNEGSEVAVSPDGVMIKM